MKRIILSILSVFITLGAAAETEQALPAVQRAATAAVEETPSGNEDTVPPETSDTPGTGTEATAETASTRRRNGHRSRSGHPRRPGGTLGADARSHAGRKAQASPGGAFRPRAAASTARSTNSRLQGRSDDGLTASYGTVSSDDTDLMLIFDNIDADATIATVKPFVGYFYRDNNCIGIRFGYSHMGGTLDNTYFDAGEGNDLSGQLPYVDLSSDEYSFGIFHRSYAGLDPKGRFGLFAEFELALSTGHSSFAYDPDHNEGGAPNRTYNDKTQVKLAFNPGAAVYIFPNVCATISFGLGGIQYTSITQKDADGNKIGSRKASNMRFRLNIAAINFGMTIHLWDKKKQ
ncbi:MAG: hypothetical protein ACLSAM_10250 [Alistipes onderdonkii]